MRYVATGRSRYTGSWLELELEARSAEEAMKRAQGLGLDEVKVAPIVPASGTIAESSAPDSGAVNARDDAAPPCVESEPRPNAVPGLEQ